VTKGKERKNTREVNQEKKNKVKAEAAGWGGNNVAAGERPGPQAVQLTDYSCDLPCLFGRPMLLVLCAQTGGQGDAITGEGKKKPKQRGRERDKKVRAMGERGSAKHPENQPRLATDRFRGKESTRRKSRF